MFAADALAGRTALVTGAGGGIGLATSVALARCGASVALCDVNFEAARAQADRLQAEGARAAAFCLDVTDQAVVESVVEAVRSSLGPIDLLVNNAGIAERRGFLDMPASEWRSVIEVNLTGAFFCAQAAARQMIAEGRAGAIVNVASVAGLNGIAALPGYTASKHGLVGLTKALALELARHRIRVNAVAPGAIETPLTAPLLKREGARERTAANHPLGRVGQPEEVAELIVFLASDSAAFITGAVVPVDGGYLSGRQA